jgi:hypothetical protein
MFAQDGLAIFAKRLFWRDLHQALAGISRTRGRLRGVREYHLLFSPRCSGCWCSRRPRPHLAVHRLQ